MKLPANAKLVFKGILYNVYHWDQKLYDGSTATFEGLKRPDTFEVIPVIGDRIYLAYEEQPTRPLCYTFLGGRPEPGEDNVTTAKRELLEETGFTSDDWELFKAYEFPSKIEWTLYLYIARNCKKIQEPQLDPGEKIEVRSFTFDEFLEIATGEDFWGGQSAVDIMRMRLNPPKLEEFRAKLFK